MEIIYNMVEIKELLTDFYVLTDCRVAVFDKQYQEVYAYPSRLSNFCSIIREDEALYNCCKNDDFKYFSHCEMTKKPVLYTCHAGLYEIIVPITMNQTIVGYIMAGQIYGEDSYLNNFEKICQHFEGHEIDLEKLSYEYEKSNKIAFAKIKATKNLMEIFSQHISNTQMVTKKKDSLAREMDEYILEHLSEDLNVEALCRKFQYRKTNFYKVTSSLYGIPIMQHIKQLRVLKAKKLLVETDMRIGEIAESVGIFDYNYFTKVFKSEVNCTPREYKKNNRVIYTEIESGEKV